MEVLGTGLRPSTGPYNRRMPRSRPKAFVSALVLIALPALTVSSGFYASSNDGSGSGPTLRKVARSTNAARAVQKTGVPRPLVPATTMGANVEEVRDYDRTVSLVDLIKRSRAFADPTMTTTLSASQLDANGWPTVDFGTFLFASPVIMPTGTYKLSFPGSATLALHGGSNTLTNQVFSGGITTADVNINDGTVTTSLVFTSTSGPGLTDVKLIAPGYTTETFTTPFLNMMTRYRCLRFMDWMQTNGSGDIDWSGRVPPTAAQWSNNTQKFQNPGAPWESVIQLANQLNIDPWINIPHQATDDYVTKLATLFKTNLNSNLHVYVEYSNEVWNSIYPQQSYNLNAAIAEVNAGGSPLNYDGSTDHYVWAKRRVANQLRKISNIFASVYGSGAINTTVRPVLAGQGANTSTASQGLQMINAVFGAPNTFFYAIAQAPYFQLKASDDVPGLTVDQIIGYLQTAVADGPTIYNYSDWTSLSNQYGLPVVAYEGGPDTSLTSNNIPNKKLANQDSRMKDLLMVPYLTTWFQQQGFGFFNWYWGSASNFDDGKCWGLTDDMANQNTPKIQAIDQFATLPPYTFWDVPPSSPYYNFIYIIAKNSITAGCGNGNYCPDASVTRAQMAVFLLRAEHGSSYTPPHCAPGIFGDVSCPNGFAVDWIEELHNENITGGCSSNPLLYCPDQAVTRAEMAVFLLKAKHGPSYMPPTCTGIFADVACTPMPAFAVDWIEELNHEGIAGGCKTNPPSFCPDNPNTRGEMAVFLVTTFSLQ